MLRLCMALGSLAVIVGCSEPNETTAETENPNQKRPPHYAKFAEARLGTIPAEPAEFASRPRVPLCGAEPPRGLGVRVDLRARECLLRAWEQDLPAELVTIAPTVEGPTLLIYRVRGDGRVEELSDDSFGRGGLRRVCRDLDVEFRRPPEIAVHDCTRVAPWG